MFILVVSDASILATDAGTSCSCVEFEPVNSMQEENIFICLLLYPVLTLFCWNIPYGGFDAGGWPLNETVEELANTVGGIGTIEGNEERGGKGSLDDERDEDTVEPGAESLELRLVLLWGRSGAELAELKGGMTPNGRPPWPLDKGPAEPGRTFDLTTMFSQDGEQKKDNKNPTLML